MSEGYINQEVRNKLEDKIMTILKERGFPGDCYEAEKLAWLQPEQWRTYTPDFQLSENVFLEAKGLWDAADRKKILHVLDQYPEITICMVFYNATYKIRKGSPTSYADFCDQHLIPWVDIRLESIPEEWYQHEDSEVGDSAGASLGTGECGPAVAGVDGSGRGDVLPRERGEQ